MPGLVEGASRPSAEADRRRPRRRRVSNGWLTATAARCRTGCAAMPRRAAALPVESIADQAPAGRGGQPFPYAVRRARDPRGAPAGLRRGHPGPPPAAAVRRQWGDGSDPAARPVPVPGRGPRRARGQPRHRGSATAGDGAVNPREALTASAAAGPYDPLGASAGSPPRTAPTLVLAAAAAAHRRQRRPGRLVPGRRGRPSAGRTEVDLLLAERDAGRAGGPASRAADPPVRVPAGRAGRRPGRLAASSAARCPARAHPQARRGSAFHAWLEHRFGSAALLDVDELPGAADDDWNADVLAEDDLGTCASGFLAPRGAAGCRRRRSRSRSRPRSPG